MRELIYYYERIILAWYYKFHWFHVNFVLKKNSLAFIQIFWVTETLIDSLLINF